MGPSAGVIDDLAVPRTRRGFRTRLFKRYQRRQAELDEAIGDKMPIWAIVGITEAGEREVLAIAVGERENQKAWEDLLDDLKRRGGRER